MNKLIITVEEGNVVSRLNGEGEGSVFCSYVNEEQVDAIVKAHNNSEAISPSIVNAVAVRH